MYLLRAYYMSETIPDTGHVAENKTCRNSFSHKSQNNVTRWRKFSQDPKEVNLWATWLCGNRVFMYREKWVQSHEGEMYKHGIHVASARVKKSNSIREYNLKQGNRDQIMQGLVYNH